MPAGSGDLDLGELTEVMKVFCAAHKASRTLPRYVHAANLSRHVMCR